MHRYIEKVRTKIEAVAGQETYLTSSLFLSLYDSLKYEDGGKNRLMAKKNYDEMQEKALHILKERKAFDLKQEVLSWQVAILRDIARDYYTRWTDYIDKKFFASAKFQDGITCVALEASCEKIGVDPTETYTAMLEVEHVLTRLNISCNSVTIETANLWKFASRSKTTMEEQNEFMKKRLKNETQSTLLYRSIEQLQEVSNRCRDNASKVAGADHLLWFFPHMELESLIHSLKGYLYCEYNANPELVLDSWVDTLFPQDMDNGMPNPNRHSPLHNLILSRLAQATRCLVLHTVSQQNSFEQRDQLIIGFMEKELEQVKFEELAAAEESDMREASQL